MNKKRCIALLAALILCLTGCSVSCPAGTEGTTLPESPAAPTQTAAQTETVPPTQRIWTEEVHCGLREDGTFTAGTLFIGDSLTYGFVWEYLMRHELLGDASYLAVVGAPLSRFFSNQPLEGEGSIFSSRFAGLTYSQAVRLMGEETTAVYLMLGTNSSSSVEADDYIAVVDFILEECPNATVHLQTIPCSTSPYIESEWVNSQIRLACDHYAAQGVERVLVADIFSVISEAHLTDGIHLNAEGNEAWYQALEAHKQSNDLPE